MRNIRTNRDRKYRVAVVGATGNVGQCLLNLLAEREFPVQEVTALASPASSGRPVSFGENKPLTTQPAETFDFSTTDIVFCAAPAAVSKKIAPKALEAGAVVIDKSSAFRMDGDLLVIPEVNGDDLPALSSDSSSLLISNPNCVVIPLLMALAPLHRKIPLKRVVIATYQAVSGAGKGAMHELFNQTRKIFMNDMQPSQYFDKQIAFNLIPQIGDMEPDGSTQEEEHICQEVKKILEVPSLSIAATCVRVPVFTGHSMAVFAEFEDDFPLSWARQILKFTPGVLFVKSQDNMGTVPIECAGFDDVYVDRLRQNSTDTKSLSFWVCCDNVRKGAALNAIQIAERLLQTITNL